MSLVTAIQHLHNQGIPTNSHIQAIKYLQRDELNEERSELDQNGYQSRIEQILSAPIVLEDQRHAKYAYLYIVQELVKAHNGISNLTEMVAILDKAMDLSHAFIKDNQYVWDSVKRVEDNTPRIRADGTVKPKQGGLKEKAIEVFTKHYKVLDNKEEQRELRKTIIQLFITEVGLTEKGAPTYYHNCKKSWEKKQSC